MDRQTEIEWYGKGLCDDVDMFAQYSLIPGVAKVLLWVTDDKPKRTVVYEPWCLFSELQDEITELKLSKKHPKHPKILKKLQRGDAVVKAFTAKHPDAAKHFDRDADYALEEYFDPRHRDFWELNRNLGDLRDEMELKNFLPGLRDRYPFHTCVIEHAEELVPGLVAYRNSKQ